MGEEIAPGLYAAEVNYLIRHEWAANGADILWRRSKLGLHVAPQVEERLDRWIRNDSYASREMQLGTALDTAK
jgi:glycerol-3-phosphate dehydrogenase